MPEVPELPELPEPPEVPELGADVDFVVALVLLLLLLLVPLEHPARTTPTMTVATRTAHFFTWCLPLTIWWAQISGLCRSVQ